MSLTRDCKVSDCGRSHRHVQDLSRACPANRCYAGHRAWAAQLAVGYATALAVYDAEGIEGTSSLQDSEQLKADTIVVPAGQLTEWVLDDLQEETSDAHG